MQKQPFLTPLWDAVTNNIVNSEHEMSTEKSLCYMAPPEPILKCRPRKCWKSPSHPRYCTAAYDI